MIIPIGKAESIAWWLTGLSFTATELSRLRERAKKRIKARSIFDKWAIIKREGKY